MKRTYIDPEPEDDKDKKPVVDSDPTVDMSDDNDYE